METLWKNEGAPGRKPFERFKPPRPAQQAKSLATGCHRLPPKSHGKECHEEGPPPVTGSGLSSGAGRESRCAAIGRETRSVAEHGSDARVRRLRRHRKVTGTEDRDRRRCRQHARERRAVPLLAPG